MIEKEIFFLSLISIIDSSYHLIFRYSYEKGTKLILLIMSDNTKRFNGHNASGELTRAYILSLQSIALWYTK